MAGRLNRQGSAAVAKKSRNETRQEPEPERSPHKNLNVRIDLHVYAAFEAWRKSQDVPPTTTSAVGYAIAEFLRSKGFDPINYLSEEEPET